MENVKKKKLHQLFENLEIGIGGVSSSLGVSQRQLRYWEKKGYIKPINEGSGVRHYSLATVYLIAFIKDQLDAGYTLEAAFKKSKEIRIKSKIARKLLRNAFDDIEVTDEAKGYGKIEMGTIKVGDKNINELTEMSIRKIKEYLNGLKLNKTQAMISELILKEIDQRLQFLIDVGLEYLTLSRNAGSLSGGESQRIRLATQIGSGLTGVLYILDEPSIGLHQRDNEKLLATLKKLRDLGNTLLVVEHDEDTMYAADQIIDIGPGAGVHGGQVMAQRNSRRDKTNKRFYYRAVLKWKKKDRSA